MTFNARSLFDINFPDVLWSAPLWKAAEARLRLRKLAAGAQPIELGRPTSALFGVLSGSIESRFSTADGHVSVVANIEPGRLFGLASFVTGLPSTYESIALAPARLLVVDSAAYTWLMDEVPGFARALMREFARQFDGTMKLLEAARHRGAEERLCIALQHLRHEGRAQEAAVSRRGAAGGPWTMQLTQAELAARANVSRQTANEWLARCAARGWIERRYRGLAIRRWPVATAAGD